RPTGVYLARRVGWRRKFARTGIERSDAVPIHFARLTSRGRNQMSSPHAGTPRLARRRLGVIHLFFFTVAASAPLTVLGGGVTTTFAVTGIAGVPLSFLLLGVALGLFSVGYAAMSRYVANAGAFYSYLANGLGRETAVGGAFVALISYNAIQIG